MIYVSIMDLFASLCAMSCKEQRTTERHGSLSQFTVLLLGLDSAILLLPVET